MSEISFSPARPPLGISNVNTAMANFEEEKSFFALMYVVVSPNTRRWVRRRRSRAERERDSSSLGRVIRRAQAGGVTLGKKRSRQEEDDFGEY